MTVCPYENRHDSRPCQGALYRDVETTVVSADVDAQTGHVELAVWDFPYSVAMSQECDLAQDESSRMAIQESASESGGEDEDIGHDKILLTVLMCPAYPADKLREGKHLVELGRAMENHSSKPWRLIKSNQNPRYHFMARWRSLQVPELVVDFKHFFTVPIELLLHRYGTNKNYVARLAPLYREDLSQRFAAYLARVGVPVPHYKIESPT